MSVADTSGSWCRLSTPSCAGDHQTRYTAGAAEESVLGSGRPSAWRGSELASLQSWEFNLNEALDGDRRRHVPEAPHCRADVRLSVSRGRCTLQLISPLELPEPQVTGACCPSLWRRATSLSSAGSAPLLMPHSQTPVTKAAG